MSDDLLRAYLDAQPDTPWQALTSLFADATYGGRVTDELDRTLLSAYLRK